MSPDTPASGSRWEPASPRDPLLADEHAAITTQLTDSPRPQGAAGAAPRGRKKLVAGAAVVALLALGGVGGYWLGHSTAGSAATAGATAGPIGHGHRGGFSDDGPGAAGSGGSAGGSVGGSAGGSVGGSAGASLSGSGSART